MKKVALLIGVSEYESGLNPLPSAVLDVDALCGVLVDPERGDFLSENITTLKNPDRQQMEEAIYWLFHDRHKDDLLLFYFSGHGIKDDRNNLYLGTRITQKDDRGSLVHPSAVAATYLQDSLKFSKSERQVIILDACYSGAIAQGMTIKDDGKVRLDDYLGGKGRAILTSSTATEYSLGAEAGLSIYTRYLVEGISTGAADLDEDDWISVDELHEYAAKKVRQAAPAMTPEFYRVQEGYKIRLAKSRRDDPKLKYEREVQKRAEEGNGEFSIFMRRMLSGKQQEWGISPEVAKEIEDRVLQPYREYRKKLAEYEQTLTEAVQHHYPFSDREQAHQKEYQQQLKLRDEDIAEIDRRVLLKSPLFQLMNKYRIAITDEDIALFEQGGLPLLLQTRQKSTISQIDSNPKLSVIEFTSVKVDSTGKIIDQPQGKAEIFIEDLGNGVSLTMVKIPAGEFLMGSPESEEGRIDSESPKHLVKVPDFYLGQTLVTQAQWQQLMGNNPSYFKRYGKLPVWQQLIGKNPLHFREDGKLPVEQVSWLGTQEFCQKLSEQFGRLYRLPSEAEWEYACRAGTKTPFYYGETITSKLANYYSELIYSQESKMKNRGKTTLVGEFPPNLYGLYDMHGNLWEWCEDHWHQNYQGAPLDGSAWLSDDDKPDRLLRGGFWEGSPRSCRSACRYHFTPKFRHYFIGFRVVCEIPKTS
jgi:formylglycine-generating enzyme required for sulfatase activity/uncharacterized caspase-like protein